MATCQFVTHVGGNGRIPKKCGKHVKYKLMPIKTDTIVNMVRVYETYCIKHKPVVMGNT
jgi:hypothetical protein